MRFTKTALAAAALALIGALALGQLYGQRLAERGIGQALAEAVVQEAPQPVADLQVAPVGPLPLDRRVVLSGHSLTDPLPEPLERLVRAAGGPRGVIDRSTIPGSPLDWRWNNPSEPVDARVRIADYDVLVITERVSLSGTRRWHNSDDWALRWARHGWENGAGGAGAEVLLYATWVAFESNPPADSHDPDIALPWRERLDREYAEWQAIMAHVNANRPEGAAEMRMIPATLVMAAVYDAIAEGQAPAELSDIGALFRDSVHLSPLGAHLVALTHYAVLYGRGVHALPAPQDVSAGLWSWMQDLVTAVVSSDPGTGIVPG
ncbi:MAG: hypothetical protein JJU19_16980 [Pararhodobacter sp.]|nr:hypothetical protein [Pararhodobacter sp.]